MSSVAQYIATYKLHVTGTAHDIEVTTAHVIGAIALYLLTVAGLANVFKKAKQPAWAAIIPIYNTILTLRVVKKPGWWFWLLLIPVVNVFVHFIVSHRMSKVFGRGFGTTLLVFFFPVIGFTILGFGEAKYQPKKLG